MSTIFLSDYCWHNWLQNVFSCFCFRLWSPCWDAQSQQLLLPHHQLLAKNLQVRSFTDNGLNTWKKHPWKDMNLCTLQNSGQLNLLIVTLLIELKNRKKNFIWLSYHLIKNDIDGHWVMHKLCNYFDLSYC